MNTPPISLVCLDLAGTTVSDDGLVEDSFIAALDAVRPEDTIEERQKVLEYVTETMGQSKIAVFRALLENETLARTANSAFEVAYAKALETRGVMPIPGAEEAMKALRADGAKIALLTGFSSATRDLVIDSLGWRTLADTTLCPAEAGRGRPFPDLVLAAVLRLEIDDVASVAVCGDTASDMMTGRRAGASIVAGVLTGADSRERLEQGGATHVLHSVADLPEIVSRRS
jgi:phosphoglycolate phosphatase